MSQGFQLSTMTALECHRRLCANGRMAVTCRTCAGNPPRIRSESCTACQGHGYHLYFCPHCHPGTASATSETASSSSVESRFSGGGRPGSASPPGLGTRT